MRWLCALVFVAFAAHAHAASYWNHNGSIVTLEADGAARKFYYAVPRPGLSVAAGSLLFDGVKNGNTYSGTAYVFSPKCGALPYPVSGSVADDGRSVTMSGEAPVRDADCRNRGTRHDTLLFTFQRKDEDGAPSKTIPPQGDSSAASAELPRPPRWTGTLPPPGRICPNEDPFKRNLKYVVICKHAEIGAVTNVKPFAPGPWEDKQDPDWAFLKQYWNTGNMFYFAREACGFGDTEVGARGDAKVTAASFAMQTSAAWDRLLQNSKFRPFLAFQRKGEAVECRRLSPGEGEVTSEALPPNPEEEAERRREAEEQRRRQAEEAEERRRAEAEAEARRRTLVVEVRSLDRYAVHLNFHPQSRSGEWPGNGKVWVLDDSEFHTYRLACNPGEKICYGAGRSGNYKIYWGAGIDGRAGCTGCCMTCGGSYRYTLNGGSESASRGGASVGDLLDATSTLLGVLGAGHGGGSVSAGVPRGSSSNSSSTITGHTSH